MTETSLFWPESGGGDGGRKYSDDEFSDFLNNFLNADRTSYAVIRGLGSELEVTGTTSPLSVANGWALVDGKPYQVSSGPETIAVPTPGASTRIDRIVLEKDFSGQTVRITRVAGTEGGGVPALTQTDGSTWQVSLAQASITTGGVITVTDEREFVWTPLSLLYNLIQRDSPGDGEALIADAASDGGAKFAFDFFRAMIEASPTNGQVVVADSGQTEGAKFVDDDGSITFNLGNKDAVIAADERAVMKLNFDFTLEGISVREIEAISGSVQIDVFKATTEGGAWGLVQSCDLSSQASRTITGLSDSFARGNWIKVETQNAGTNVKEVAVALLGKADKG